MIPIQTGTIAHEWRQTEEDVYIDLNIGEEVDKEDVDLQVFVNGRNVVCQVTVVKDGRRWTCALQHAVVQASAKILVKDGALTIHLQKKDKFKEWKELGECIESRTQGPKEKASPGGGEGGAEIDAIATGASRQGGGDEGGEPQKGLQDEQEVFNLHHVKHDFYPRQDLKVLYLHVYVKKIIQDSVKVIFSEHEICMKFKTKDVHFIHLNAGSSSDTLFCWKVKPWKAIDPKECKYKLTPNNLEVIISKQKAEKWQALECSTKADFSTGTRGRAASQGDWVPLSANQPPRRHPKGVSDRESGSAEIPKEAGSEKEAIRGAVGGAKSVEIKEASVRTKKPTCTVTPLTLGKAAEPPTSEPPPAIHGGYCGLDNLGNTCFMNSVLQVLANTRELKDFMLGADFKNEINRDNPLGSGGHLVLSFAVLMRRLWGGQHKSIAPSKLKSIISAKASQFMGFAQHDAQEFMAFLLDGLHEDINRIQKKPYTETVDSDGRPDQVVADEAWKTHRRRNDSFIVDLFQGQYKSKLVCPECNKVSITFDPFMHLSMPLPKKKRRFPIYFFSRDSQRRPVRYVVSLPADATAQDLMTHIAQRTGVQPANLRVFEVHRSGIHKVFSRRSSLAAISFSDVIFVHEVLSPAMAGESVVEVNVIQRMLMPPQKHLQRCSHCKRACEKDRSLKRCTKCYRAAYCDQACQKSNWAVHRSSCRRYPEPVGCPFVISLPQSHATYARLCQIMESYARYSTNVFVPPLKSASAPLGSPSHTSQESNQDSPSSSSSNTRPAATPTKDTPPPPPHGKGGDDTPIPTLSPTGDAPQGKPLGRTQETGRDVANEQGNSSVSMDISDKTLDDDRTVRERGMEEKEEVKMEEGTAEVNAKEGVTEGDQSCKTEKVSPDGATEGAAMATVVGHPQTPERKMPLFFIKPVGHTSSSNINKERLKDEGDEPLNLSGISCLAVDWRNDPKQENNVLVETKSLDFTQDESDMGMSCEENEISLNQCLSLFTEPEKLSPEEAWYCPKCKQHREATKQMMLWRLPSTLIIQLKRFSFGNMLWRDKIDKMVEYPVRGLDLSPYCHSNHSSPLIYDLYGVINHHGGILGGHYTSFARLVSTADWSKNEHDWRLHDDNHVTPMSEKNVVTRSAYLLFYRRRQPYVPYIWRTPTAPESDREPAPAPEPKQKQDQHKMDAKSSCGKSSEMEIIEGGGGGSTSRDTNQAEVGNRVAKGSRRGAQHPPPHPHQATTLPSSSSSYLDNRSVPPAPPAPAPPAPPVCLDITMDTTEAEPEEEEGADEDIGYTNMEDID